MKAQAEIVHQAIDAAPQPAAPFWGVALLGASLGTWVLIIGAARLIALF